MSLEFPRSTERGPIEARTLLSETIDLISDFRVRQNAAPLKQWLAPVDNIR
jgi:hypothetical protein